MKNTAEALQRKERTFLSKDFHIKSWADLEPYFNELLDRRINSSEELRNWFADRSELESVISEDLGWRYIYMTRFTENEKYARDYRHFVEEIQPNVAPFTDKLNKKAIGSEFLKNLEKEPGYNILIRALRNEIKIFREKNIPLFTEIQMKTQLYGQITGAWTVEIDGKELTLQQAGVLLQLPDRSKREEVYYAIGQRRLEDGKTLDKLFHKLISLRHQVADNADFQNFRDYMFSAMGRFDYSPADCFDFHNSVKEVVVPMLNDIEKERKEKLGVNELRPWDKAVDPEGRKALKPFSASTELTNKTIKCFTALDPYLGECLSTMKEMGHLDLDSRKGKAPGGYNYPLAETGVPFIFMNATSTLRDMVTILHEGGHAVHSFLTRGLELSDFKNTPSEVAELASMSMELISMEHWDIFFENEEELKRAKREHLEQIIETLPWVATIDKFQHWIYENPFHTKKERTLEWNTIFDDFSDSITDWAGLEKIKSSLWQKQLHLYEVPFYYIEYGMAQLGAVAIWRNFKTDRVKGLQGYMKALKLGYTHSIPEIYEAAEIRFDFSKGYIRELMGFVKEELRKI